MKKSNGEGRVTRRTSGSRKAFAGAVDTNVLWGRDSRTGVESSPSDIHAALEPWGAARVCAASIEAILCDTDAGNASTLALARRDPFFLPVAVLNPRDLGAGLRAARAREEGFVFARLFPDEHGYTVDGPACLALLDACDAAGLPVMMSLSAAGAAPVARALAGRRGCCILTGVRYTVQAECLALARANPGILVETSMLNTPDGVAVFAGELGAGRLVFGSGFPALAPGCTHRTLKDSGLPEPDIAQIVRCAGLFRPGDGT